jgi:hypothetical protein
VPLLEAHRRDELGPLIEAHRAGRLGSGRQGHHVADKLESGKQAALSVGAAAADLEER